jgi:hypothetical protein
MEVCTIALHCVLKPCCGQIHVCVVDSHRLLRSVFAVSLEFGIVLDVDELGGKQRFD